MNCTLMSLCCLGDACSLWGRRELWLRCKANTRGNEGLIGDERLCVSLNVFSRELPQTFSTHGSISGSDTPPLTFTFYCLLQVC